MADLYSAAILPLVACPHHVTPLADHFLTFQGQTRLLVSSALATSGRGRGTLLAVTKAIAPAARLDDWLHRKEGPLDRIAKGLLRKIRYDRNDLAWNYLSDIERNRGAVLPLTPEGTMAELTPAVSSPARPGRARNSR